MDAVDHGLDAIDLVVCLDEGRLIIGEVDDVHDAPAASGGGLAVVETELDCRGAGREGHHHE